MANYSRSKIKQLLHDSDHAGTNDEKGAKLEELIEYLFAKLRGVVVVGRNTLDGPRAHEIDLSLWNPQAESGLQFLDPVVFVECKNTGAALGSAGVGWFVRKLQDRGSNSGVLVSLCGITGAADGVSNAHSEVLSALTRDKLKILLMSRDDILSLRSTDDLIDFFRVKYTRLVLYRTVN